MLFSKKHCNSDCKGKDESEGFFDVLYGKYHIERVWASRSINANPDRRGKLTEILVSNYKATKMSDFYDNFLQPISVAEEKLEYKNPTNISAYDRLR